MNIETELSPVFPGVVETLLTTDEIAQKTGLAYRGSNPSYEIKLPSGSNSTDVVSADIQDSAGTISRNIPFNITKIPDSADKVILTLKLPGNIAIGDLKYALNFSNKTSLTGNIKIIDFARVSSNNLKEFSKPSISEINVIRHKDNKITLFARGKNFVGRKIFIEENNTSLYFENQPKEPHSSVTIFPKSLNTEIIERSVSKDKKTIKIKFKFASNTKGTIHAVLVVATPRGIASKGFLIRNYRLLK